MIVSGYLIRTCLYILRYFDRLSTTNKRLVLKSFLGLHGHCQYLQYLQFLGCYGENPIRPRHNSPEIVNIVNMFGIKLNEKKKSFILFQTCFLNSEINVLPIFLKVGKCHGLLHENVWEIIAWILLL